eukprot:sb/3478158/
MASPQPYTFLERRVVTVQLQCLTDFMKPCKFLSGAATPSGPVWRRHTPFDSQCDSALRWGQRRQTAQSWVHNVHPTAQCTLWPDMADKIEFLLETIVFSVLLC